MKGKNLPIPRLKEVRQENNATQADFARLMGCDIKTYRKYEKGAEYPKLECLITISDTYHKSIDYLLGRSDFTTDGNEYISSVTGLSDKSIEKLRGIVQNNDKQLAESNKSNYTRLFDDGEIRPVLLPLHQNIINFVVESKSFVNLICTLAAYFDGDKFKNFLDSSFHKIQSDVVYPADENFIGGGFGIPINKISKNTFKEILEEYLYKLSDEYNRQQDN